MRWVVGYVRDIQEPILILVLLVDAAHQRGSRRQDLIDEDENGLLRAKLDALADDVDELAHGEVGGDEVLLLVDGRDVALLHLLADHLYLLCQQAARAIFECMSAYVVVVELQ